MFSECRTTVLSVQPVSNLTFWFCNAKFTFSTKLALMWVEISSSIEIATLCLENQDLVVIRPSLIKVVWYTIAQTTAKLAIILLNTCKSVWQYLRSIDLFFFFNILKWLYTVCQKTKLNSFFWLNSTHENTNKSELLHVLFPWRLANLLLNSLKHQSLSFYMWHEQCKWVQRLNGFSLHQVKLYPKKSNFTLCLKVANRQSLSSYPLFALCHLKVWLLRGACQQITYATATDKNRLR